MHDESYENGNLNRPISVNHFSYVRYENNTHYDLNFLLIRTFNSVI